MRSTSLAILAVAGLGLHCEVLGLIRLNRRSIGSEANYYRRRFGPSILISSGMLLMFIAVIYAVFVSEA